jgi:dihydroorotase
MTLSRETIPQIAPQSVRIQNARTPEGDTRDLLLHGGELVDAFPEGVEAQLLDAAGLSVAPGLVDLRAHLREPGFESKERLKTGSRAAARGGFTSVVVTPDTNPPIDNAGMVEFIERRARETGCIRIYISACATKGSAGAELTEMAELRDVGVVAVTDTPADIDDTAVLRRVLDYARMVGLPYMAHCEDRYLTGEGHMHEGFRATLLGMPGLPAVAETMRVDRACRLAELTGTHVHIQNVSAKETVETVRQAKARGANVTADTAPPYFSLTDEAVRNFDTHAKMYPPLREQADVEAVIEGLRDGTLDAIVSNHEPHTPTEKGVEFALAPFGALGLETCLAATLTYLVQPGHLSLAKALALLTTGPAGIVGIEAGTLNTGAAADVTLFDPEAEWTVTPADFASISRNSPYLGHTLRGRVRHTWSEGRKVFTFDAEQ